MKRCSLAGALLGAGKSGTASALTVERIATRAEDDPHAGQTHLPSLLQQHTLNPQPRQIFLRFASPLAFRRHGHNLPLPLPELVFGHLVDRWNALHSIQLHPEARRYGEECAVMSRYNLRSQTLRFGESGYTPVTGGLGTCRYVLRCGDGY